MVVTMKTRDTGDYESGTDNGFVKAGINRRKNGCIRGD